MRELLTNFLIYLLCPLWVIAGAADYICHWITRIEHTSGVTESWLHLAQLLAIVVALSICAFFEITAAAYALLFVTVVLHSVLAHLDIAYTLGRRHISAFEQHVHGYLNVIPMIAVMLVGVIQWDHLQSMSWLLSLRADAGQLLQPQILMFSFVALAGSAIAEELWRTHRAAQNGGFAPRTKGPMQ